jgi:hypothetical protein
LREENMFGVFENMVLRKLFGPKRNEVTEDWRKLQNKALNVLLSSPNIYYSDDQIKKIKCAGHVACTGRGAVYTGFDGET